MRALPLPWLTIILSFFHSFIKKEAPPDGKNLFLGSVFDFRFSLVSGALLRLFQDHRINRLLPDHAVELRNVVILYLPELG